ncbi:MAG: NADH-quinone oxidoreductase subunit A [Nitrospinota bacterium]|nr:NADH-quinone oxidoreductase subunit A [Nitrospinota bacterium]MDP6365333.1 NADH-quinone oxidoreductase subunit A [Nitrospinota bacterium]MDP7168979.1 NADH-quinone oxidoreductase subunit A [Nitrospinota bacterium]MDP7369865.1 NADH-quinone oxidoreductase subunit A [Nitrospinota bacterium]MDP7504619.1 NADH-quinone oxidoreductase subunit A [Nitrospinota bacterium]
MQEFISAFFGDYNVINGYVPLFIFLLVALGFAGGTLLVALIIRPNKPDPEKLAPYECGMPPLMEAHERFSIRFYLLGILFLLFDVEAMFLFPWAVKYDALGLFGFIEMMLFIAILLVGYFYAWRKGALEWA